MSSKCTISNIQFDYAFNQMVKDKVGKNGLPLRHVLMFKTICCLPDTTSTKIIGEWYAKLFGEDVSQTAISRINYVLQDEYGLIEMVDNPHGSAKFTWLTLTPKGRKLQKLFIGSSSDWKDKPRTIFESQLRTAQQGE